MSGFDFRTELFRLRLPINKVASQVNVHPSRLSWYLNGRLPMPDELKHRLGAILREKVQSSQSTSDAPSVTDA